MDCSEAHTYLLDWRRGTLSPELRSALEEHLETCNECRREDAADRQLSVLLESRLPRPQAPEALRHAVQAQWESKARDRTAVAVGRPGSARKKNAVRLLGAMAIGAALAVLAVFAWRGHPSGDALVTEALNDHLRVLYSDRPLEVASSDRHVVKPWFTGRVDFAPDVAFNGDDEFPLQGGAVAYFVDRKAAAFLFKRRLHWMSVFVFRADGLAWPVVASERVGDTHGTLRTAHGFRVLLWRKGDLGYAVVSDVDERDVRALADRIAGVSPVGQ
jgi:anti-sigma factor RsiW